MNYYKVPTSQEELVGGLSNTGVEGNGLNTYTRQSRTIFHLWVIITVRKEVAKVRFSQACVCPQGGAWSRGVPGPRGSLVPGGAGSGGCLLPGRLVSQHALKQTPPERRLLLRTVHILLECILVFYINAPETVFNSYCIISYFCSLCIFTFMFVILQEDSCTRLVPQWSRIIMD